MEKIKEFILNYIQREYTLPEGTDVDSFNYVESGYVDSLGFIQFIAILEDEFGIQFTDEEMEGGDIKVIGRLAWMIGQKQGRL